MRRTIMRKFGALLGGFSMLASQAAVSEAQQKGNAQVPATTIRVATHLVLVDVVATDKQGKPVLGLKAEDFTVQENGKTQKVAIFVTPEGNQAAAPTAALPPGIYSNRPEYRSPRGPVAVLLLDATNTQFKDQAYARIQMLKFVREQYKPGQHMAVLTLTDSLHVLQDFTTDPQLLYDALERFLPQERPFSPSASPTIVPDASVAPAKRREAATTLRDSGTPRSTTLRGSGTTISIEDALRAFSEAGAVYDLERRTEITFEALDALARGLGGLPGRKNVIWVTGDLPFSLNPQNRTMTDADLAENLPSLYTRRVGEHASGNYAATARGSYADQIRDAAARLSASQVALYPVDARGLSISLNQDAQGVMREMASDTGGRAYVNQNEIKYGVERALADTSATYTLGYYPENKKWDGSYRNIKVKLERQEADLQYRRGYFALDPTQLKGYKPASEAATALTGPVPATQVAFSARVLPSPDGKGKLGVDFLVDASTVYAEDASNGKKMNVVFYVATLSGNGKIVGSESMKVDRTFDADSYQQIMQRGMMLHMELTPPSGAIQLRLAVQDGRTGLVGTIDAPLNNK